MGTVRILSTSSQPFLDRVEAGQALAQELEAFRGQDAVVLGIPRGGVVVAQELARALDADLDIVLARKLGAPGNPELAVGAIAEDGQPFVDEGLVARLGISREYVERERERQLDEIARRSARYRAVRPRVPLEGRLVIVTDDGLATGSTMLTALRTARADGAARVVGAVPVGPEHTVHELARHADEMVCLRTPPFFAAVGEFYRRFDQTSDDEVLDILRAAMERGEQR